MPRIVRSLPLQSGLRERKPCLVLLAPHIFARFFAKAETPASSECERVARSIERYLGEAQRTHAFDVGEALLTLGDANTGKRTNIVDFVSNPSLADAGAEGGVRLQETLPVLRSVEIGARDSGDSLQLQLDYWTVRKEKSKDKDKDKEKGELKAFQYVGVARLAATAVALGGEAPTSATLALIAQPRDRKKRLAKITGSWRVRRVPRLTLCRSRRQRRRQRGGGANLQGAVRHQRQKIQRHVCRAGGRRRVEPRQIRVHCAAVGRPHQTIVNSDVWQVIRAQ